MRNFLETEERRIIPRWRDSSQLGLNGELAPLSTQSRESGAPAVSELAKRLQDWKKSRTIGIASDLVSAAFVLGLGETVTEPAQFLLDSEGAAPQPVRNIAADLLGLVEPPVEQHLGEEEARHRRIRSLRKGLRAYPRDPLRWIDLARSFANRGLNLKADRAMRVGLVLAPHSRFVLRAASRFYIHIGEPALAQKILWQSTVTKHDPWLLAAEIATSEVLGKSSRLIKLGRSMISSKDYSDLEISELAAAIGSLELSAGNDRKARKFFRESLIQPTDNSIAQAEWVNRRLRNLEILPKHLEQPLTYEARAIEFYVEGAWARALEEAEKWQEDEPFSHRPPALGTFIAAVALDDYASSVSIARRGLLANPHDPTLRNNLAFSLASQGLVEDAERELAKANTYSQGAPLKIAGIATRGLIDFRKGRTVAGRAHYHEAIDLARGQENKFYRGFAAVFLLREEILAKTEYVQEAQEICKRELATLDSKGQEIARLVLDRLDGL